MRQIPEQINIFDFIQMDRKSRWKNKDHKAFDVLLSEKYGHMNRIIYNNPACAMCPKDDYTDAIDRALLALYEKTKLNN